MNEPPNEWLRRLFEYEYCPECGGDAEDHEVWIVLGNYFARCKIDPLDLTCPESHPGGARCSAPRKLDRCIMEG